MTPELTLYVVAAALLAGATALLLRRPHPVPAALRGRPASSAEFFPVHCRYFLQVRNALSREDAPYLAARVPPVAYRRWRKGIRRAGRLYLAGLREDFSRLNHLARHLSLYSPQLKTRQELELLRLNLYFQLLYGIVWWRFVLGRPAGDRLEQMASLIGSLGSRLEQAAVPASLSSGAITP